jgi:undecaprenyl-diphosphatase
MTDLDARIFLLVYAAAGGVLTWLALLLSAIGSGWIIVALVATCAIPRWRRWSLTLGATLAASGVVVFVLKKIVDRHRPCVVLPGVHALCAMPTDPSFPSGHACGAFTAAVFIVVVMYGREEARFPVLSPTGRGLLCALLVTMALGIAWSRVYLGVHFPIDVTVGAFLGAWSGALGGKLYLRDATRGRRPCPDPIV